MDPYLASTTREQYKAGHRLQLPIAASTADGRLAGMMTMAYKEAGRGWLQLKAVVLLVVLMLVVDMDIDAAPIPAANLESCHDGFYVVTGAGPGAPFVLDPLPKEQCCPVLPSGPVVDFSWDSLEGWPVRERRAAHLLDEKETARLNRAYQLMLELPDDDPRSLLQQRKMHCSHCSGATPVPWNASQTLDIHWSWFLLPWHRWFLYFHERILASLLGDPTFALPFWNWDNFLDVDNTRVDRHGRIEYLPSMIPRAYVEEEHLSAKYFNRTQLRMPPVIVNFTFNSRDTLDQQRESRRLQTLRPSNLTALRESNLNFLHQVMVSGATTPTLFMGGPYRYGFETPSPLVPVNSSGSGSGGGGTLELGPHGLVHSWTGNETLPDRGLMADIAISAYDPTFYIHHGNVDRLWEVWKTIPGGWRTDFNDSDWLDTQFVFYDEKKDLVKVRVRDALNPLDLRFSYQSVAESDNAWITYNATRCANLTHSDALAWLAELQGASNSSQTHNLRVEAGKPVTIAVPRPKTPPNAHVRGREEVLFLEKVSSKEAPSLQVFLFQPAAGLTDVTTCTACAELAGVFTTPPLHSKRESDSFDMRVGIGPKLRQLGLADVPQVAITIRVGPQHTHLKPLTIKRVRIQWET